MSQPPLVYFMGGIIVGCFGAVVMLIYSNKNMNLGGKGKKGYGKKKGLGGIPNTWSPSAENLDDEKNA